MRQNKTKISTTCYNNKGNVYLLVLQSTPCLHLLQSSPMNPCWQIQLPFSHLPFPLQLFGHLVEHGPRWSEKMQN